MKIGVYKITNPSGRIYIGSSRNIDYRWSQYKTLSNSINQVVLHRSFKKYGIDAHEFEVVEECSIDELYDRERYWQEKFGVLSSIGLNCNLVDTNSKPKVQSKETKYKMKTKRARSEKINKIGNMSEFRVYGVVSFNNERAWRHLMSELSSLEFAIFSKMSMHIEPYHSSISCMPLDYSARSVGIALGVSRGRIIEIIDMFIDMGIIKKFSDDIYFSDGVYVFNPYISFKDRYDIKEPMVRGEVLELFKNTIFVDM